MLAHPPYLKPMTPLSLRCMTLIKVATMVDDFKKAQIVPKAGKSEKQAVPGEKPKKERRKGGRLQSGWAKNA